MSALSQWAANARKKQYDNADNEEERAQAVTVIESLLNGEHSASTTARSIAAIYQPRIESGRRITVGDLWGTIIAATTLLDGAASELLVDLIIAIGNLPDVVGATGVPIKLSGCVIWRDLPDWAWLFREYGIGTHSHRSHPG